MILSPGSIIALAFALNVIFLQYGESCMWDNCVHLKEMDITVLLLDRLLSACQIFSPHAVKLHKINGL